MTDTQQPAMRPADPRFSSGPCKKHPGWTFNTLSNALLGRSHRSAPGKARLLQAIEETRTLLGVPDDYHIGIVPASDTGAMEMALWSLLGARPVDVLAWESFGKGWATDITAQLKLDDVHLLEAPYGELPDLGAVRPDADVIFTWNGTTSGVRVPNADWISETREGLSICDATSAAFAQELDWPKLDVVTFSWQKVLGGEAAHGMLILSPRAVKRLQSYTPPWPLPKIFRLTKKGKLIEGIFKGATINTPSMMAVEDYLEALKWSARQGGLPAMIARADANLQIVSEWVEGSDWADFLCADPTLRSNTSVCLKITDGAVVALSGDEQAAFAKTLSKHLETEGVALDIGAYRDAPPGLRIWCGGTVEANDVMALMPWLDWAFARTKAELSL
ncbi:MAG: phosphoserine transaminase [Robiginitomaculum sp.]|nr:phosphoserine transaminase [Robiginitomaculum sp.]MDQ7078700.1 phosphoserine transaminase [Robiginitomaculum sp.]